MRAMNTRQVVASSSYQDELRKIEAAKQGMTVVTDARGVRHDIPDLWLAGNQLAAGARGDDPSIEAAIDRWLIQAFLAEQEV